MRPYFRVFLSAVSSEFRSAREWVASDLRARGLEVKEQRDFRQERDADTTLRKLHNYIAGCDAVVAVVGARSGPKPPSAVAAPFAGMLPDGVAEASYTQWEVHFARHHRRRLSFYVAGADWVPDEFAPNGFDDPALQAALVHRLFQVEGLDRRPFSTVHELRAEVLREDWPLYQATWSLHQATRMYSCFISYSSKDEDFAQRLHADLKDKGVQCWFAPHDMPIGAKILDTLDEAIRLRDKVLLVLSEASIASEWVEDEVTKAFAEERQRGGTVLFPIRVDNTVFETGEAWARKLRDNRHIGDFRGWKEHDAYRKAFDRLLRDLRIETHASGSPSLP